MKTSKTTIISAVAGLAMAAIALTGCVATDDGSQSEAKPMHSSAPETSAPAESAEPTQEATDETEASDAGKEGDDRDESESETTGPPVPLTPDDEEGVMYLHPIQAFSPLLERWVVDTEGKQVHYTRYTCLGTVDDEGYGSLKSGNGDTWEVTWEGESPMRLSSGQTTSVEITDTTLTSHPDVASTHTDMEVRKYTSMCTKAGKGVADFVLG